MSRRLLLPFVLCAAVACGANVQVEDGEGGRGQGGRGQGGRADGGNASTGGSGPGPGGCASDEDCVFAEQWCVGGECVPCDNGAEVCDIGCSNGWSTYRRHGCSPCECGPPSACTVDAECGAGAECYAGSFCWDYCGPGDPTCCIGNICSEPGCPDPPPVGCDVIGCPDGQFCSHEVDCAPSSCFCSGGSWICNKDCSGGVCVTPL